MSALPDRATCMGCGVFLGHAPRLPHDTRGPYCDRCAASLLSLEQATLCLRCGVRPRAFEWSLHCDPCADALDQSAALERHDATSALLEHWRHCYRGSTAARVNVKRFELDRETLARCAEMLADALSADELDGEPVARFCDHGAPVELLTRGIGCSGCAVRFQAGTPDLVWYGRELNRHARRATDAAARLEAVRLRLAAFSAASPADLSDELVALELLAGPAWG